MVTAQILSNWGGILNVDMLADEGPSPRDVGTWTSKLEIINIYNQEK
jgi:hypothetical protein